MNAAKWPQTWQTLFNVQSHRAPLTDNQISKDWLNWIEPAPADAAELDRLAESIHQILLSTNICNAKELELVELFQCASEAASRSKKIRIAIQALEGLPSDISERPQFAEIHHNLKIWAEAHERALEKIKIHRPKKGRGRPRDEFKLALVHEVTHFLETNGKVATGGLLGTITKLASWLWREATKEVISLDAWAETLKRAGISRKNRLKHPTQRKSKCQ